MDKFSDSKAMRRFFVSPQDLENPSVVLKDDEFHHLKNVCRLEEGEKVELLDGQGKVSVAVIKKMEKKQAVLEVLETSVIAPMAQPHIQLVLCLPRFQKMDDIIQKSVELGVKEIFPVFSERSFVKKPSEDLSGKILRWNKIGLEACKQSGRAWPMEIHETQELNHVLKKADGDTSLFLYEGESALDIKKAVEKISSPQTITVFIGAEGGFSPQEVASFNSRGLKPITLGDLVLRVETACIAIISVIKYHYNLMR